MHGSMHGLRYGVPRYLRALACLLLVVVSVSARAAGPPPAHLPRPLDEGIRDPLGAVLHGCGDRAVAIGHARAERARRFGLRRLVDATRGPSGGADFRSATISSADALREMGRTVAAHCSPHANDAFGVHGLIVMGAG